MKNGKYDSRKTDRPVKRTGKPQYAASGKKAGGAEAVRKNGLPAVLKIEYETAGADSVSFRLSSEAGPAGEASAEGTAGNARMTVPAARLWSPSDPYLYGLQASAEKDGEIRSWQNLRVGIRTFRFDPDTLHAVDDPAAERFLYQGMREPWATEFMKDA